MPYVEIKMLSGRSNQQKRNLVESVTDALVQTCGSTRESVQIVITDVDSGNWGSKGQLMSDKEKA